MDINETQYWTNLRSIWGEIKESLGPNKHFKNPLLEKIKNLLYKYSEKINEEEYSTLVQIYSFMINWELSKSKVFSSNIKDSKIQELLEKLDNLLKNAEDKEQ